MFVHLRFTYKRVKNRVKESFCADILSFLSAKMSPSLSPGFSIPRNGGPVSHIITVLTLGFGPEGEKPRYGEVRVGTELW